MRQIPVNENVFLDRERCVLCDRCTRFADQVAGDSLIHFIDRGNKTQVNTYPDQPFSSYFSGNTVQICPVGALTAAPFRFKARPWELSKTNSIDVLDGLGSSIQIGSKNGQVLRVLPRLNEDINEEWIGDKSRFAIDGLMKNYFTGSKKQYILIAAIGVVILFEYSAIPYPAHSELSLIHI